MKKTQKAIIIKGYWDDKHTWNDTTCEINALLTEGWTVVTANPMGTFGYGFGYPGSSDSFGDNYTSNGFASLVILEKTV